MKGKIEKRCYSDWFGSGDTEEDYNNIVEEYGEPLELLHEGDTGYMICLIYKDKIVVTGYDGSEYHGTFEFERGGRKKK